MRKFLKKEGMGNEGERELSDTRLADKMFYLYQVPEEQKMQQSDRNRDEEDDPEDGLGDHQFSQAIVVENNQTVFEKNKAYSFLDLILLSIEEPEKELLFEYIKP